MIAFITIGSMIGAYVVLSVVSGVSLNILLDDFLNTHWIPDGNTISLQTPSQLNSLFIYYVALVIAVGCVFLVSQRQKGTRFIRENLVKNCRTQVILIITILIFSQTLSHYRFFQTQIGKFFNKTITQKLEHGFRPAYAFAQYCQGQLPGSHRCVARTDIDISPKKYLLTYLAVRYYVYPLDVIARDEIGQKDCIIVFLKDDPDKNIPEDFEIGEPYDQRSLIAVRKGLMR